MNHIDRIDGKSYRICFYNTEMDKVLYRHTSKHELVKWDYYARFNHNDHFWVLAKLFILNDGNDVLKDVYFRAITSELKARKEHVVLVPIESNSKLSFDLAIKL